MSMFFPLSDGVQKDLKNKFFVFDVETRGLSARPESFIFGCMYGHNFQKVFYTVDDFKAEFKKIKYRHKYIFAHNAEYDLTTVYGNILENLDESAIFNSRFILAQRNGVRFADSFNILPSKLANIGKILGIEKLDLNDKFKTGSKKITVTKKDIEYCMRDCEIVYEALMKIFTLAGDIKPTIAGLSMNFFRRKYLYHSINNNDKFNEYFYKSYYGGRVECFKIGKTKSYKYDVNSMYPHCMAYMNFPNPETFKIKKKLQLSEVSYYLNKYEGVIDCDIEHKKTHVGYLPYRSKKEGKLIFPCGKFSGSWNFNEIRFAVEQGIVKIKKVNFIVYSQRMKSIFGEYVTDLYTLKNKNKDNLEGYIYKLFLNSLYGRFGQKMKIKTKYFASMTLKATLFMKELESKNIEYEINHYSKKDENFKLSIFYPQTYHYSIPSFASYITSESRILLLKLLLKHEQYKITYCDTDSIAVEKLISKLPSSDKIGKLKLERSIITSISGNKFYSEVTDGVHNLKIKGIPKIHKYENEHYLYSKMIKTNEAIRRKMLAGTFIQVKKKLKKGYTKRTVNKNTTTSILTINE